MMDTADYQFTLTVPAGANFTAASLMHRYAAEHKADYSSYHGRAVLTIAGIPYGYDHWELTNCGPVDQVTVYLFNCASLIK